MKSKSNLRIGVIHNFYRSSQASGENQTVNDICELLEQSNISVSLFSESSDRLLKSKTQLILTGFASVLPFGLPNKRFRSFVQTVDAIQIHNSFPALNPVRIKYILRSSKPIVRVLHNYRSSCLIGTNFRNGQPCSLCSVKAGFESGVALRCYQNSKLKSYVMKRHILEMNRLMRKQNVRLVAISEFVAQKYSEMGFPRDSITVIPNSVPDPKPSLEGNLRQPTCIYLGRLSDEKGCNLILKTWDENPDLPELNVAGSGPLGNAFKEAAEIDSRIKFHGLLKGEALENVWSSSRILICPSLWDEPFGRVAAEALARGKIVLTSGRGGLGEIILGLDYLEIVESTTKGLASSIRKYSKLDFENIAILNKMHFKKFYSKEAVGRKWSSFYRGDSDGKCFSVTEN